MNRIIHSLAVTISLILGQSTYLSAYDQGTLFIYKIVKSSKEAAPIGRLKLEKKFLKEISTEKESDSLIAEKKSEFEIDFTRLGTAKQSPLGGTIETEVIPEIEFGGASSTPGTFGSESVFGN